MQKNLAIAKEIILVNRYYSKYYIISQALSNSRIVGFEIHPYIYCSVTYSSHLEQGSQ